MCVRWREHDLSYLVFISLHSVFNPHVGPEHTHRCNYWSWYTSSITYEKRQDFYVFMFITVDTRLLSVFLCICWYFIHFDFAGGQRAGQPLQVSQFERQQDEADATFDVHRALRVQEVVRCPIPNVFLKSLSHRLVHPVEDRGEVRKMKRRKMGRRVCPDVQYIPDYGVVGVDPVAVSWLSQLAGVADHCASTATGGEGPEVHNGRGNDLEHLWHHFL